MIAFVLIVIVCLALFLTGVEKFMGGDNPYVSAKPRRIIEALLCVAAGCLIAHRAGLF